MRHNIETEYDTTLIVLYLVFNYDLLYFGTGGLHEYLHTFVERRRLSLENS